MNIGKSECIKGKHLRDSIESHKLDIWCPGSLLSRNLYPLLKCTSTSFITNTWKFMCVKNRVVEERPPNMKLQCQRYTYLMEDFIKIGIQGEELSELNICGIFLQDTCRLVLATGDGKSISSTLWHRNPVSWKLNTNGHLNQGLIKEPGKNGKQP